MNKEIVSISSSTDYADSENLERKNDKKEIHNRQENLIVGDDKNNKKIEIDGNKIEEKNNSRNENENDSEKKELLSRLENLEKILFEKMKKEKQRKNGKDVQLKNEIENRKGKIIFEKSCFLGENKNEKDNAEIKEEEEEEMEDENEEENEEETEEEEEEEEGEEEEEKEEESSESQQIENVRNQMKIIRQGWSSQFAEKEKEKEGGKEKEKENEKEKNKLFAKSKEVRKDVKNNEKELKKIKNKNSDNKKLENEKLSEGLREKERVNNDISGNVQCASAQDIYSNQLSRLMFMAEEVMSRK